MTATVLRPGMLTTVQDGGRYGFQHLGVPCGGPMDWWSFEAANRLVGNAAGAAALEVTFIGPELEFGRASTAAVVGAPFALSVSGRSVPMNQPFAVAAGETLVFGARSAGARAYVAVDGGFAVPAVMGSRATHLKAGMGGVDGRALRRGDVLPLGGPQARPASRESNPARLPVPSATLRAIAGPDDVAESFWTAGFSVSPQSDRMGYRLEGPAAGSLGVPADQLSSGVAMGTVQATASGTCVLLMADRATSGGYARASTVITADLPLAGQLAPGDTIRFTRVSAAQAREALAALRATLP